MNWQEGVGKAAYDYHCAGFHCAEAVLLATVERLGQGRYPGVPEAATAFGGGIGNTSQHICGALTGGVIALGYLFGRSEPSADWTDASELAAALTKRFDREYGTTRCEILLERFGPQEDDSRCKQLSGEVAGMLEEILQEHGKV